MHTPHFPVWVVLCCVRPASFGGNFSGCSSLCDLLPYHVSFGSAIISATPTINLKAAAAKCSQRRSGAAAQILFLFSVNLSNMTSDRRKHHLPGRTDCEQQLGMLTEQKYINIVLCCVSFWVMLWNSRVKVAQAERGNSRGDATKKCGFHALPDWEKPSHICSSAIFGKIDQKTHNHVTFFP